MPQWTAHANQRWTERFPDIDKEEAYLNSSVAGKKTKSKIKLACAQNARLYMSGTFAGRYFRVAYNNIIFVVQAPELIITVFPLKSNLNMSTSNDRQFIRNLIANGNDLSGMFNTEHIVQLLDIADKLKD